MTSTTNYVSVACRELARRGRWRDALSGLVVDGTQRSAEPTLPDLVWLHDLYNRLGCDVRRQWVARRMARSFPDSPTVHATRVRDCLRRNRLSDAWRLTRGPAPAPTTGEETSDWALARARVHAHLRDHDVATRLIDEARATTPNDVRVEMEAAWTWQERDRLDLAFEVCRAAQTRWPDEPLLRLQECWFLHDGNDPRTLERMAALRQLVQSTHLDSIHANHCLESGDPETARRVWSTMLAEPHHEPRARLMLRVALVRTCRELGDDRAALAYAETIRGPAREYAVRLRRHVDQVPAPGRTRVTLPVPFVRQDHLTCSPATMSSLLATFGVTVDQREIAAQITYDGTASRDELKWARSRGFVVRFFQFEPATARRLLDLGLPFAITTRFETNSHRQAVVGYDSVLDTFLLRDPTGNFRREVDASWLTEIAGRGGECALLLPHEVAERSDVPELPGESATMEWLALQRDWRERNHEAAERRIQALLALPAGPLRFDFELRLSVERGDRRRQLELYEGAFESAPNEPFRQFHFVAELLDQNQWQRARSLLEQWAPTTKSPFLRRLLADQLRHDAQLRAQAIHMMERALRQLGRDARAWNRYASMLWDDHARRDDATEAHRIAAMLAPHDEWLNHCYAWALREQGRTDAAIDFLRGRVAAHSAKSAAPAGTLARCLEEIHRSDEAIDVLRTAIAGKEDAEDQHRQLFDLLVAHRRLDEAERLLSSNALHPTARAMSRHALARLRGDHVAARAAIEACLAQNARHEEANRLLLEDLLERDGVDAATAIATKLTIDHAGDATLMLAVADFYDRVEDRPRQEAILRRLVEEHPHEHWLRGRLARHLVMGGRSEEAQPLLDQLRVTSPGSSPVWLDIAHQEHALGNHDAARAAARRAFELAPGRYGLRTLVDWAPDSATAAEDVRFAMRLITERPVAPDADLLEALGGVAPAIPRPEYIAFLKALEADFPGTTAPIVAQCEFALRTAPDDAVPLALSLVRRQPWYSPHHLRLAACFRATNKRAKERAALERLLEVDPGCAQAYVDLGESFDQEGRVADANAAFGRGLAHHPGHAVLHGMTADAAWRLGNREAALTAIGRACDLDRSYVWALSTRVDWLIELDRHGEALQFAESIAKASPRWPPGHELHARALAALGRQTERIAALRRAVELSPRLGATRLRLIDALIELKRFDDAREVIAAGRALSGDEPPLFLRDVQIERTSGRLAAARERLRGWLDGHPDHADGWIRYLTWCEEEGRDDDILELHSKPPGALRENEVLFGYAADVLQKRGDDAGADAALRKALALAPGYQWARNTLCTLVLRIGQPERVFELLPDHGDPAALPYHHAATVAEAAARTGRHDLAHSAFDRLLGDPEATCKLLGTVDDLLRRRRPSEHERRLKVAMQAEATTVTARNVAKVFAMRGQTKEFLRALSRIHRAADRPRGDVVVAAILADLRRERLVAATAGWVAEHVQGPVPDTGAMGDLLYALSDVKGGANQCVRLFLEDWRRPDVRGWMLANLADALYALHDHSHLAEVCTYALEEVPHDHSIWWHRRYLADQAMREGRWTTARELCEMPIRDHPAIRLAVQQIDLVAELRTTPWLRRASVLRRRLRESFHRADAVRRSGDRVDLRPWRLLRACPHPLTVLLCLGPSGTRIARTLLGA